MQHEPKQAAILYCTRIVVTFVRALIGDLPVEHTVKQSLDDILDEGRTNMTFLTFNLSKYR
jgi:hypothetical protein